MNQIALAGNPNTGKTTLFNQLTGSYEYVGNWAGVTVEKKVGTLKTHKSLLVDLPGIYSLNPISKDESVTTSFLIHEEFNGVINIIDASQLHRNLHLTVQLLEMNKPLFISLNMMDVAKQRGIDIDVENLSHLFNVPVYPVVARSGKGCNEILSKVDLLSHSQMKKPFTLDYGEELEQVIKTMEALLPEQKLPKRWYVLRMLEGNEVVKQKINSLLSENKQELIKQIVKDLEKTIKEEGDYNSIEQLIYHVRSSYIDKQLKQCVSNNKNKKIPLSERLDHWFTHPVFGIPIFLIIMFLAFKLTFDWLGTPLSDWLDGFITGPFTEMLKSGLVAIGASNMIQDVILNGIVAGVGGVLVFVPQIFILFFLISWIEDSGYMARVAVVMDRLMEAIGLNGKAIIPLIIGFGCNVPGVMAARTIEQQKDRLLTILMLPLMSCSARLTVYSLFVGAFFKENRALIVFSLYVLGIIVAIVIAKIFSIWLLRKERSIFVIELPPYRMPQVKTLMRSTWDKGKGFVRKAGTFILAGSVVIWLLSYVGPSGIDVPMDQSFMAVIGSILAPILAPLGFGTWQAGASLITGFLAKEVVVSSMNIIYVTPNMHALQGLLTTHFTALQAYSFMAFILLYTPCLATVGVIKRETGSRKWTIISVIYSLVVAYIISLIIYQGGRLLGL